jgi:hypothetical protein
MKNADKPVRLAISMLILANLFDSGYVVSFLSVFPFNISNCI